MTLTTMNERTWLEKELGIACPECKAGAVTICLSVRVNGTVHGYLLCSNDTCTGATLYELVGMFGKQLTVNEDNKFEAV